MTERSGEHWREAGGYSESELFAMVTDAFSESRVDPYLQDAVARARRSEQSIRDLDEEGRDTNVRRTYAKNLDDLWEYNNQEIEISGQAWLLDKENDTILPKLLVGAKAISRGFSFVVNKQVIGEDADVKVAYWIETEVDGNMMAGVVCLDDCIELVPPYPSPEMRERQFVYYHSDIANILDYETPKPVRDDQALLGLQRISFQFNFLDSHDKEHASNAEAFIRSRIPLEKYANYEIGILGEYITETNGEQCQTTVLQKQYTTVSIRDIVIRPRNLEMQDAIGKVPCVPFIYAIGFDSEGNNYELYIPTESIGAIRSLRYPDYPN